MTPFDAYVLYLALKRHFTSDGYDFFKYNGRVSASVKSFDSRRDRYLFEKLAKKRDPRGFVLSHLIDKPKAWIREILNGEDSEGTYLRWLKRNNSLSYIFREELSNLKDEFDDNFSVEEGGHPLLLKLYLRGKVSLETLIILMHMTGCWNKWSRSMQNDPIWRETALKIKKYQPFMSYDIDKFRKIVIDKFK